MMLNKSVNPLLSPVGPHAYFTKWSTRYQKSELFGFDWSSKTLTNSLFPLSNFSSKVYTAECGDLGHGKPSSGPAPDIPLYTRC